eukprot:Protomagalhaensia_wolfi_Nauph_80__4747@NODE_492_length_2439_cov_75_594583_g370_i0_p1_GENE_NODE_492_length_2439_cov_75_594583_g370_i0NODE_492_length_2439_cov_75_594583_g370_i0_p1_ORF_typecomplete_len447_score61_03Kelch_3/PF13415_6/16Kelch_3/PF13415_6/0_013Kelch_4/PF13418_6/0_022Kelch_4/PF13418_6/1_3e04UPF0524/PF15823_5/0_063Kelch_6/PF13964_6/1_1e03Kelch_6/PF13964_6/0_93Kelch_6/PF13964_6/8_7e03Kelch_6/PF13964_6/7_9e03Dehydrin/PF00257_19/0_74DUF755/PF05501_11/2_2_NODE_492_length_2439_cov_75_594583_
MAVLHETEAERLSLLKIGNEQALPWDSLRNAAAVCSWKDRVFVYVCNGQVLELRFGSLDNQYVEFLNCQVVESTCSIYPSSPSPPPRRAAAMAYASPCNRPLLVLTGGISVTSGCELNDVWAFHLGLGIWEPLSPQDPERPSLGWHSVAMLDGQTLAVLAWNAPAEILAFHLLHRHWYKIDVPLPKRASPILKVQRQRRHSEVLELVVGGGIADDNRTFIIFLRYNESTARYVADNVTLVLQRGGFSRLGGTEGFYEGLQIGMGGLRPEDASYCEILDVFTDEYLFKGDIPSTQGRRRRRQRGPVKRNQIRYESSSEEETKSSSSLSSSSSSDEEDTPIQNLTKFKSLSPSATLPLLALQIHYRIGQHYMAALNVCLVLLPFSECAPAALCFTRTGFHKETMVSWLSDDTKRTQFNHLNLASSNNKILDLLQAIPSNMITHVLRFL